jgi:hypothetical protein
MHPAAGHEADLAAAQREYWQRTYTAHPAMYGDQPSAPAVHAAELFAAAGAGSVLELGAGHGRDALYFARCGFTMGRSQVWWSSDDDALVKIASRDGRDRFPAELPRVQRAASGMRTVMYGCGCSSHSLVSLTPVVWLMTASMAACQS